MAKLLWVVFWTTVFVLAGIRAVTLIMYSADDAAAATTTAN